MSWGGVLDSDAEEIVRLRKEKAQLVEALRKAAPIIYETSKVHARSNAECPCKDCEVAEKVSAALRAAGEME